MLQDKQKDINKMRTIRTKVYKFEELTTEAQQKAINHYRNNGIDNTYIYDDAHSTVNAFNDIFGTKEGSRSWLDITTGHIDDNILELTGLRLHKYIINNYWSQLFKGKYYNCKSNKQIKHRRVKSIYYKNSGNWGNYYYSAITFENSCVLTGMCYDDDILAPIYDFLKKPNETTFEELLKDCIVSLEKTLHAEEDYLYTDEAIREELINQENEYTKDGNRF